MFLRIRGYSVTVSTACPQPTPVAPVLFSVSKSGIVVVDCVALTPMMQQYIDIKENYPDTLLMFRLGDFYELFFEDAVTASKALDITLTGRDAGEQGRVPMCGVPYHAGEQYIAKLIDQGHCVAICEQMEDPKQTKGLVKREVVRVITPGTALRDEGSTRRILAALVCRQAVWGIGFADVSTGEVWFTELPGAQVFETVLQWHPTEVLVYSGVKDTDEWREIGSWCEASGVRVTERVEPRSAADATAAVVCTQYSVPNLTPLDLTDSPVAAESVGLVVGYIQETQKQVLAHLRAPQNLTEQVHLSVDYTAQRNLELLETTRTRQRKGSLYGLLDVTKTAMGSRLLRTWVERPLRDVPAIQQRLDAVNVFVGDVFAREQARDLLEPVYDLDRLTGRVAFGTANARDLKAIAVSLQVLPALRDVLSEADSTLLRATAEQLPNFSDLVSAIENKLVELPPVSVRDGGLIRQGADAELDELRSLNSSGKEWLAALEQRERDRTGIRTLKIGYNKVFGYFIEVSKANAHLVPEVYERRQTLASAERYTLKELKEQESRILNAEERAVEREYELFSELREQVMAQLTAIQQAAELVAIVDALCAMATVSSRNGYVRPQVVEQRGIDIRKGRHPMVEDAQPGSFVPNDVTLGGRQDLILLTGPNMAGKSTYMRQTALIVLMAHLGCYVPAEAATIGLVDRIFTRIGASDDLGAGQSTFMVEMVELAQILRQATSRSLVVLDEIGRGTSTYDGMSIAEAVMEALQRPDQKPLTLFATHYHELTGKAEMLPSVGNYSVLVQETASGISFLHTVVNRPADKSYGIQVAKLAGIPLPVIERAIQILSEREQEAFVNREDLPAGKESAASTEPAQVAVVEQADAQELPLFTWPAQSVLEKLVDVDVYNLTPLQAMNTLFELVREAQEVVKWDKSK